MTGLVEITSGTLTAAINPLGAELTHLRDAEDRELMTDADPAFWTGHAPILFPIVGALNGDTYRIDGQAFHLPKHGFARRSLFECVEQASDRVRFRLTDSDATRAVYPFAFALEIAFAVEGGALGTPALPAGKVKEDPFFGKVETYRGDVVIALPMTAAANGSIVLAADSQGCADVGVCYPAFRQKVTLALPAAGKGPGPLVEAHPRKKPWFN